MANQEHLNTIRQGTTIWNKWRKDHPEIDPDLREANLFAANLRQANLSHVNLIKANLSWANLSSANLYGAKLLGTNLSGTNLSRTNISGVNLKKADLSGADLTWSTIFFTDLRGADLSKAVVGFTIFGRVELIEVNGLDSVEHRGPSTIGIDTIYRSQGKIIETFLRGAGVPNEFIIYARSLVGKAIEFYSCFISFTESDDYFSEKLYTDLQSAGVSCWRWKEDAKLGKTLMGSIDEAVRINDKVIVICSKESLNSPGVIREIERALQREDELARSGKEAEVLFPIRLDDYIFHEWNHYRKADVLAKNVGDFRQWKNTEVYCKKIDRLIRDLKAEKTNA